MTSRRKATVRIDMPGQLQMLNMVGEVIGELASAAGFDEDSQQDIQTAVHESVANAIVHGNRGDESRRVRLEIDLDGAGIEIRVRDQGGGFDPARLPDALARENLCRTSGRGILLMKALMDAVAFRCPRSGGTEVTMGKRLGRTVESVRACR